MDKTSFIDSDTQKQINAPLNGTLIHGTHRMCDLIPAMLEAIRDTAEYAQLSSRLPSVVTDPSASEWDDRWQDDDVAYLHEELTDIMERYAPEGYYFGPRYLADGNDIGYWRDESYMLGVITESVKEGQTLILNEDPALTHRPSYSGEPTIINAYQITRNKEGVMVGNKTYMVNINDLDEDSVEKLFKAVKATKQELSKEPVRENGIYSVNEILAHDDKFRYQLLSRMQSDVKYFLGNGNRHEPDLWAGNVDKHIDLMYKLWDSFKEKPKWLTREEIDGYAKLMRQPGTVEQVRQLSQELKDILLSAGLEYSPLAPKFDITLKSLFNSNEDVHLCYATFEDDRIHLYKNIEDAYVLRNYEVIDELKPENQLQLLQGIIEYYRNENNNVTIHIETQQIPGYALPAIYDNDWRFLSQERADNIHTFLAQKKYADAIFNLRDTPPFFTHHPAFGQPTDCVTVDILRTGTIKQFREEHLENERNKVQQAYDDFVKDHGEEPLYAEVTIRYKDDGESHLDMIKLSNDADPRDEDKVFYYVTGLNDLKGLISPDNGEDFRIVDVEGITFHSRNYFLDQKEQNNSITTDEVHRELQQRLWKKLDGILPENGDRLLLNEPFVISAADGLTDSKNVNVTEVRRSISPSYEQDIFVCGDGQGGINTFRLIDSDLHILDRMLNERSYGLKTQDYSFVDEIIIGKGDKDAEKLDLSFDEHGEYATSMEFHDGYALEVDDDGKVRNDEKALRLDYPKLTEVAVNYGLQSAIGKHTGRIWSEGSHMEKIHDIALTYGKPSYAHEQYVGQKNETNKSYHIAIGTDNRPGGVEGEYHLQFKSDIMNVTFGEQEEVAKEFGGTMRVTDGQEWADFYDKADAIKFAEKIVDMNMKRTKDSLGLKTINDKLRNLLPDYGDHIFINEDLTIQRPDRTVRIVNVTHSLLVDSNEDIFVCGTTNGGFRLESLTSDELQKLNNILNEKKYNNFLSSNKEKDLVERYQSAGMGNGTQFWPDRGTLGIYQAFAFKNNNILVFKDADDSEGIRLSSLSHEERSRVMDAIGTLLDKHIASNELAAAKAQLVKVLDSAIVDLGDTILIKPTTVKVSGIKTPAKAVFLAPDGKGGGEFRLAGEGYSVLATGKDGHTEFDVSKILDDVSSVNGLMKAVHDVHVAHLEGLAKHAIHDRITNAWQRFFTPDQLKILNRYHQVSASDNPAREVFSLLLDEVKQEPDVIRKPEKWITETAKELNDLAEGITREEKRQLKV